MAPFDMLIPPSQTPPPADAPRPFVAVIGLHRSGSSCLAGVLHHLGVLMGHDLVGYEPTGGFEDRDLVQICDLAYPQLNTERQIDRDELVRLLRGYIDFRRREAAIWNTTAAGKYPTLCAMGDELAEACPDLRVVHINRPLEESIRSMVSRLARHPLRTPHTPQQIERTQRWLWDRKQSLLARMGHVTVEYADLLRDPQGQIDRLIAHLNLEPGPARMETAVRHVEPARAVHSNQA